jgi:hypothetical protein
MSLDLPRFPACAPFGAEIRQAIAFVISAPSSDPAALKAMIVDRGSYLLSARLRCRHRSRDRMAASLARSRKEEREDLSQLALK